MSKARRERIADWLMLIGAPILFGSLFETWSHQLSASLRARFSASAALAGVPVDPTAWEVYSAADILLAIVAAGLLAAALRGGRPARIALALGVAIAIAFTVHALSVPPTNGATVFDPTTTPAAVRPNHVTSGPGEVVALIGLALGAAGLALSFTAD